MMVQIMMEIHVKIISIDNEKNRVSLGLKQLEDDPWDDLIKNYEIGISKVEQQHINFHYFWSMLSGPKPGESAKFLLLKSGQS